MNILYFMINDKIQSCSGSFVYREGWTEPQSRWTHWLKPFMLTLFLLSVTVLMKKKKTIEKPLVRLAWMMSIEGARSIFYCAWNQASSVSPSTCLDRLHAVCLLNSTNVWTQRNRKTEGISSTLVLLLDNWTVKLWDFPASGLLTQEKHSYQCFFLIV